ncbi:MAG: hypothetical protein J6Q82_02160 [Clostridia bacterium]|nr:hypothetical protein [Clostridia bacterium]
MNIFKSNPINQVWQNICRHEGESFSTIRGISYQYVVKENYILINNDPRRKVKKEAIEKALLIQNPSPSKLQQEGFWANSYLYGIITDARIKIQ